MAALEGSNERTIGAKGLRRGSLVVVGTGIEAVGQATLAAEGAIRAADVVLYVVGDALTVDWIVSINPAAESLNPLYARGRDRRLTYQLMVDRILRDVRAGLRVCAVFYGHPGVAVTPAHHSVLQARAEGYHARMLPGVSALDCLICDLGVDLGTLGFQSYEATSFLMHRRLVNPFVPLILWQIGVTGTIVYEPGISPRLGYSALMQALTEIYGAAHEVTIYRAALWTVCNPQIESTPICDLESLGPTQESTLYVPPKDEPPEDAEMVDHLGVRDLMGTRPGETR